MSLLHVTEWTLVWSKCYSWGRGPRRINKPESGHPMMNLQITVSSQTHGVSTPSPFHRLQLPSSPFDFSFIPFLFSPFSFPVSSFPTVPLEMQRTSTGSSRGNGGGLRWAS